MSQYFSRLARKTGLIPRNHSDSHSGSLQENSSATRPPQHQSVGNQSMENQTVAFHTDRTAAKTDHYDITEKHETVNTSNISATRTPALYKNKSDITVPVTENTGSSSTENTPHPAAQMPGIPAEPQRTVKTDTRSRRTSVTTEYSDLSDQKPMSDIQPDKNLTPGNKKHTVKKALLNNESPLHSRRSTRNNRPTKESIADKIDFSTNAEKTAVYNTTALSAHDAAHGKNTVDIAHDTSQAENRPEEKKHAENPQQLKPASLLEIDRTAYISSSAQPRAKQNRQQAVRINIGHINIDIQQSPDTPPAEKVSAPLPVHHSGKSQSASPASNETRLSRYYLSGW